MKTKNINRLSIVLMGIIMLITGNNVQAQQGRQQGPPPTPSDEQIEKMIQNLDKALALTDEQEKQVSQKYFTHFAAVEKKMKAGRPNREDIETMETDFEKDVSSLLTDNQQDLYKAFLKEQQQKRPRR